mgnify:CR=1 FL=1
MVPSFPPMIGGRPAFQAKLGPVGSDVVGGSGAIVLFRTDVVNLTAKPGQHYLQGAAIGTVKGK